MNRYTFECSLGHAPEVMVTMALSDDEALVNMMNLVRTHIAKAHATMPPMSEEQMMSLIKTTWTKQ